MASEAFEWEGAQARLLCDFENETLSSVSSTFFPEEDETGGRLGGSYPRAHFPLRRSGDFFPGEPDRGAWLYHPGGIYLWERTEGIHTALVLTDFKQDGSFKYILLSVYQSQNKRKEKRRIFAQLLLFFSYFTACLRYCTGVT